MPEVVSCPKCGRKSRVPDHLLGKRVKCPGCSEVFTARAGAAPPRPHKKADDEDDGYEVVDEGEKKPRRDDDEDDRVSDKPRPRRARKDDEDEDDDRPRRSRGRDDDDEDDDEDRVTSRRRRYSRDDDDDDEDDEDGEDERPGRTVLAADWPRVRMGFTLLLASALTLVGQVLVGMVGGCCMGAGMAAQMGKQAPGQPPDMSKMTAGIVVITVVSLTIGLAAKVMMLAGCVMCLPSPRAFGAKTLALVTLGLSGGAFALQLIQQVVNLIANGMAGMAAGAGGNPFAFGGRPGAGGAIAFLVVLGVLGTLLGLGSFFTFGYYVRSIGFCLRDYSLARTAKSWLITLTIAVVVGLIGIGAVFAILGAAIWTLARGGAAGPGGPPGAGPGGGPGAALGGGMIAAGGLMCILLILMLALFVWYIIMLAQARGAITARAGRQRY